MSGDLDDLAADVDTLAGKLSKAVSRLTGAVDAGAGAGATEDDILGWVRGQHQAAVVRGAADADVWGQVADALTDACARRKRGRTLDGQRVELRLGGS